MKSRIIACLVLLLTVSHGDVIIDSFRFRTGASASDNFDSYANGASLGAQANWSTVEGALIVVKPAADGSVHGNSFNADCCIRRSSPTFSANHESEITIILGDGNGAIGVTVRCQSGAATYYDMHWDDAGNTLYLARIATGTWTEITHTTKSYTTGNKLRLEVTGTGTATRLTGKEDTGSGWVTVFNSVDPGTYIDGGQPGIFSYNNVSTWATGDNWSASDL